jgi:hypothetical protein
MTVGNDYQLLIQHGNQKTPIVEASSSYRHDSLPLLLLLTPPESIRFTKVSHIASNILFDTKRRHTRTVSIDRLVDGPYSDPVPCESQVVKVDKKLGLDLTLLRWYEPGESYYVGKF